MTFRRQHTYTQHVQARIEPELGAQIEKLRRKLDKSESEFIRELLVEAIEQGWYDDE